MFSMSIKNFKRSLCTCKENDSSILVKSLKFFKNGPPSEVLKLIEDHVPMEVKENQVLVKILAAPIHTADIENIRGNLANKCVNSSDFPIIPGLECAGEVHTVASDVQSLSPGQRVIIPYSDSTWTTYKVYDADDLTPVPSELGLVEAATLAVNPCIAYRILKDFIVLKPGDCILLNGSNTSLGLAIHQLCKAWNLQSVGIIPTSDDVEEVKKKIHDKGANMVLTLNEFRQTKIFKDGNFPKPLLGLSCVARSSSRELSSFLDMHGVMVSYGCMAGKPVATCTTGLIFKDFVQRSFWMMRWDKEHPKKDERNKMINELCALIAEKKFCPFEMELVPLSEYKEAINKRINHTGIIPLRMVLDMQCDQ